MSAKAAKPNDLGYKINKEAYATEEMADKDNQGPVGGVGTIVDITERKLLSLAVKHWQVCDLVLGLC